MPDPEIMPDPDGQNPPTPTELPGARRPGQDIPDLPARDPLGGDVKDGPEGLEIGPE